MDVPSATVPLSCAVNVARAGPGRPAPEASSLPPGEESSDAHLLAAVARRDGASGAALEQLFVRYSSSLLRFMARFTRSEADAEDIVHDCFVRVAESAGTWREEGQFRTWLFSMGLNLARSLQRRRSVREKVDIIVVLQQKHRISERAENHPAQSAETTELLARVDAAIATLADAEREIFLLYWFGELKYPQISEMTGVSVSAAKVRVHRAMARLGKMLKGLKSSGS